MPLHTIIPKLSPRTHHDRRSSKKEFQAAVSHVQREAVNYDQMKDIAMKEKNRNQLKGKGHDKHQ